MCCPQGCLKHSSGQTRIKEASQPPEQLDRLSKGLESIPKTRLDSIPSKLDKLSKGLDNIPMTRQALQRTRQHPNGYTNSPKVRTTSQRLQGLKKLCATKRRFAATAASVSMYRLSTSQRLDEHPKG